MKYEAISRRELSRLIRTLKTDRHFRATRGGHTVDLKLTDTLFGPRVDYAVWIRRQEHCGRAETVSAAVDAINQLSRRAL